MRHQGNEFNRRTFLHLTSGALLTAAARASAAPSISENAGIVRVQGSNYLWQYTQNDDRVALYDARHRLMVNGVMQPAVIVCSANDPSQRRCSAGTPSKPLVEDGKVILTYAGVNGQGTITLTWSFDEHGIWTEPVDYQSASAEDIVSFHYFAANPPNESPKTDASPSLHPTFLVVPGVISGSTVSPILHNAVNLNNSFWLGRGSFLPGIQQQWALPVHYFCGFSTASPVSGANAERNLYTDGKSDAFTCGLADLPGGDLFLQIQQGNAGPWIDYRSDLWHHQRTPGRLTLGATLLWTIAPDYYESIAAYYQGLLHARVIQRKQNSPHKMAVSLTPQFCTWGAQRVEDKANDKLDEAFLNSLYGQLKASGMQAGLFSIDDKWEGVYGTLEHDQHRLPHFEQFLAQLRADGLKIGMWAAIMRCERPADLGLTLDQMLRQPDGKPFIAHGANNASYYIADFTQPQVATVLTDVVRRFMRRYKPDVFKFDFGYELPAVGTAAPLDKQWTGERLMAKGLNIVIRAMRAENPDIVVMYYNLSPLFLEYFDLHSPDDLWMDIGDYDIEANRRLYFSSLMGQLGVPTYGSSGYDWSSSPSIWFDSAALGTIGCLNDFGGDEQGETPSAEEIARYNGITHILRSTTAFEILPFDTVPIGPTLGAHARSWARFEEGQLVLLAQRPPLPGEENRLMASRPADPRVKDVLQAKVPVIVASKNAEDITRSRHLAIVACGAGEIRLRREQGKTASITHHFLHGSSNSSSATVMDGKLKIDVRFHQANGDPLEWIDVQIS